MAYQPDPAIASNAKPSVTSTSSGPAGLRRARFDCGAATVGGTVKVGGTLAVANAAGGFTGC